MRQINASISKYAAFLQSCCKDTEMRPKSFASRGEQSSTARRGFAILACAVALTLTISGSARAQVATTGTITGTVSDNTGAVMPGVTVAVSGAAMMGESTVTTGPNGEYRIPAVNPGVYTLTFSRPGFGSVRQEGINITVDFTATINATMSPASVSQNVTVISASPVVDLESSKITNDLASNVLQNLPNKADFTSVLDVTPGIVLNHPEVGGSGAIAWAYGPRYGIIGQDRGELEGMNGTESGIGGSDAMFTDEHADEEVALTVIGNNAEMNQPGTLTQMVVKSGGNAYHGHVSEFYENHALEATNIDAAQLALGVVGGPGLAAVDTNQIQSLSDFSADTGGYIKKDKVWWFGAYRYETFKVNFANLVGAAQVSSEPVYTGKVTYNLSQSNKLIGFFQKGIKHQNPGLYTTSIFPLSAGQTERWADTTWKGEWDSVITPALLLQVRGGEFLEQGQYIPNDQKDNQYTDIGLNTFTGSDGWNYSEHKRFQLNGSLTYFKQGWLGSHNFKFGGETYPRESDWTNTYYLNNIRLTLDNGAPSQVTLYLPPKVGYNDLREFGIYAEDTWKVYSRLTLNIGVRFDQYLAYTPPQTAPTGQEFPRINAPTFNNVGPRIGGIYALTKDGKTLVKANFGQFWQDPFYSLAANFNPNAPTSSTYVWTPTNPPIVNGLPVFVPGSQGKLLSTTGTNPNGTPAVTVNPNLQNSYLLQATGYFERELAANFGIRTGFVWNSFRQPYGEVNTNQPYDAFNVPVTVTVPGPDNSFADSKGTVTAYNLASAYLNLAPNQVIQNIPLSLGASKYYNWEISATKRNVGRWSLMASYVKTWAYETPVVAWSAGNPSSTMAPYYTPTLFNPNTQINTVAGLNNYTNWTAKFTGTYAAWWGIKFDPTFRTQGGAPFARTFNQTLNYTSAATIKAELFGAERLPTINIFDLRTEKEFTIKDRWKVSAFFDVYNFFNDNATQTATESSGNSFLRPTTITGPRIAAYGAKLDF
jgi:Carboxypeptidase regulatory-like domain/TonB dependent receptor